MQDRYEPLQSDDISARTDRRSSPQVRNRKTSKWFFPPRNVDHPICHSRPSPANHTCSPFFLSFLWLSPPPPPRCYFASVLFSVAPKGPRGGLAEGPRPYFFFFSVAPDACRRMVYLGGVKNRSHRPFVGNCESAQV